MLSARAQARREVSPTLGGMRADPNVRLPVGFATLVFFTLVAGDFWRYLIGWMGFVGLALLIVVASAILFVRLRPSYDWRQFPKALALFLLFATASLAWSFYPGASALGLLAQWCTTFAAVFLALCFTWADLLRALGWAFRWILGLSLLFELFVATVIRRPVLPFWTDYGHGKLPEAFYWSRGLIFHGGQIQGILRNSNLL